MPDLAIIGATVIDGTGAPPLRDGVIVVRDGRVAAIGGPGTEIPSGAIRLPADGQYVTPGLMDANVHLFFAHTPAELIRCEGRYEDVILEAAQVALRCGITTVFDTWGPREALTSVRDRINQGREVGSRIHLAGNIIGFGGPTSEDFVSLTRTILSRERADEIDARFEQGVGPELLWMTPEEVRHAVRRYIESGTQDFLKYAGSGHVHMQFLSFSEAAQRAIVEEAHAAGLTAQAHTTSPESLRLEIEAGADILQHPDITGLAGIPDSTLRIIAERQIPCAMPLMTRRHIDWIQSHGSAAKRVAENGHKYENGRRLIRAGARVLMATDSGVLTADAPDIPLFQGAVPPQDSPVQMGQAHLCWFEAAGELGMSSMDALVAATRNIASAYRVDRELGTIERGKRADLLVLDQNPLTAADAWRAIDKVLKDGVVVDRGGLPNRPVLTRA